MTRIALVVSLTLAPGAMVRGADHVREGPTSPPSAMLATDRHVLPLPTLAIVGAFVLTMEDATLPSTEPRDGRLPAPADGSSTTPVGPQTIVVRDGVIVEIGPVDEVIVPADAQVIDGRDHTVLPGLCDLYAHVHEGTLLLFLANGITTVRNTAPGRATHLVLRDEVATGLRVGPRIVTTGPVLDGLAPSYSSAGPIGSVTSAEEIVAAQAEAGYDGIMVYAGIEPLPYLAVLQAARRRGLPVSGHLPHRVPRELFYGSGQHSKENLIGEIDTATGSIYVPAAYLDADVQAVAATGIWTVPTLTIHRMRANRDVDALGRQPELRFLPPRQVTHWSRARGRLFAVPTYEYLGAPDLVRRLHAVGARIGVGTDAGYPFILPGFSIHDEITNLIDAGLTPEEVLRAATRGGAEYLGELDSAGTVTVGKRADLLLVPGSPLQDPSVLRDLAGVVVSGRWLSREDLQTGLEAQAAAYGEDRDRFADFAPLATMPTSDASAGAGGRAGLGGGAEPWERPGSGGGSGAGTGAEAGTSERDGKREGRRGPGPGEVEAVHYEIFLGDLSVGEERIARIVHLDGTTTLRTQSSIDPHLATRTEMEMRSDASGIPTEVRLHRWMAGATWDVGLEVASPPGTSPDGTGARRLRLDGSLPSGTAIGWTDSVRVDALLGGPLQAVNLDVDLVATLQLVVDRARDLVPGAGLLVPMLRVELNEEEHGRDGVLGETAYWVLREAPPRESGPRMEAGVGAAEPVALRIFTQGLNGAGTSVLRVEVASEGWIEAVREEGGAVRIQRVEGP